ncbi:LacI family DNA-binding transcriptional regulator [Streptomyces sp. NPDC048567]|uniref:LacI family DNA-binding transcriptional regulator n=2 Tax=Streptomyces TaxID=1883 RepID=UPI00136973DA|nr:MULTISPECIES: LacI family DNA-binding transcriptional regulator [unclassified Streptomyces]MYW10209.1 substrate-binding domain-containing protein [Streptomyces sp. SID2563]WUC98526.1 LacI family transcriptional regulator [Streptomyces sp. NBC_00523]
MARKPTIADVARRAGVSRATVSFALNDRPGVAEETKLRILAASRELGWTPSRQARALSLGKAGAFGLVLARDAEQVGADPFFPAFIAGVEAVIGQRGDGLMIHITAPDNEQSVYRRLASEQQVDGVLLTDLRRDDPRPALLRELGLPAVVVGQPEWGDGLTAVSLDDEPAYTAAVRHLAELGHRRIAHVEGPQELLHAHRRRTAWEQTLRALGLPEGPVLPGGFTPEGGAQATRQLLGSAEPPTAIVYGNDLAAMAGLSVAQELGVRVPDQLSLVGYDDAPLTRYSFPPLASARADARGWGEAAARALDAVVAEGAADHVRLPPAQFVPRASMGPAPRR